MGRTGGAAGKGIVLWYRSVRAYGRTAHLYGQRYGREGRALREAPSRLAVLGRYIINPEVFPILEATKPGRGNEIQLTDALKELAKLQKMYAYNFEGRRYDVGDKQGFLEATVEMALKRPDLKDKFLAYLQTIVSKN